MGYRTFLKAIGSGQYREGEKIVLRLVQYGCTNRPYYHVIAQEKSVGPKCQFVEHVGSWDPIRNERGEQLVALNVERISYWLSEGATCSNGVAPLLGLAGILPIHPNTYLTAWRNRKRKAEQMEKAQQSDQSVQSAQ